MASIAQAAGVDAVGLINLTVAAARNSTTHRRNCDRLASHVRMIGNLLEKLKTTGLRSFPATGEPLDLLEEALGKALELVESCREKSYLYMLAMGWSVVYRFRLVQNEIDRYLKLVPLISLVHEYRMQNLNYNLLAIEQDHPEYTLEEEEMEAHGVLLKKDRTKKDASILENSLSRRYPDLEFHEALQEEKEKLHVELHRSQENNDPKECQVIEHLIEVTKNVVNVPTGNKLSLNVQTYAGSGYETTTKSSHRAYDLKPDSLVKSEWQADLFDCCMEPCLSFKACIYPCGIFSHTAQLVSKGQISRERACNDLIAYSLFCCCCCYTCSVRRKLRKLFNVEGGACDDFFTHLICCCCAMVQEWRELELRGFEVSAGCPERKMIPPPYQYMKP
ncbi:cell number regulator 13-like isoform X2 [Rhododendron vialii]|uniref:cell number regulator 13-like isoform X2 n=1 Tax=Rhododendron vialii TaxID=182163 RepID=UPI00265FCE38|nr:cell number regulator 13-like isoform X2 [Rhododendron vialii]